MRAQAEDQHSCYAFTNLRPSRNCELSISNTDSIKSVFFTVQDTDAWHNKVNCRSKQESSCSCSDFPTLFRTTFVRVAAMLLKRSTLSPFLDELTSHSRALGIELPSLPTSLAYSRFGLDLYAPP
mmetsp:Transcript_42521/g.51636  ORF Transcript_42521/g.51636 Transcript_42521/m.51636 type:complete len:125 (-) Transcript_42521:369-743(-)